MNDMQWNWIQSFIEVANAGSLSKAAAILNTSQPTLSRQMAALESALKLALFNRSTQGLQLTEEGARLLECSLPMQQAANKIKRVASGTDESLVGSVRISANEVIALYYLPPLIAEFNVLYPQVQVEIDVSNKATSLTKRDADIALRMFRPSQPDLVAKRLPDIPLRFCGSRDYLENRGFPLTSEDLSSHNILGFDREQQMMKEAKILGLDITPSQFLNKTDFLPLHIEMARKGAGISVTHLGIIEQFPELELLLTNIPLPSLEFWLVCHADVQHNRRIRTMVDFLGEKLS